MFVIYRVSTVVYLQKTAAQASGVVAAFDSLENYYWCFLQLATIPKVGP